MVSFEEHYKSYSGKINRYIKNRVGNFHDGEDIFQTVFLKFHNAIKRGVYIGNFKAWLYSVAEYTIRDWIKYEKIRPATHYEDLDEKVFDLDCNYIERGEEEQRIKKRIRMLNGNYREVLDLRYAQGLELKEISKKLGLSETNTKVRLHRSKIKLKELFN